MPYRPNFPIPSEINPPRSCLCIPIPNTPEWRAIVAGLFTELTYWYNYERTGDTSGAECAAVWKEIFQDIDWSTMSCCCDDVIIYIWDDDGELEQSDDGGVTYDPVPEKDPRNNSPVYPPVPGEPSDDKKCIAATSIRTLIEEQVTDQFTDDMTRYTLGQLIHDWVTTYLQTSNPFEALIQIATNQIFALIIATLRPALTDGVFDTLTCILIDHMADDLSFDADGWEGVRSDILSGISGIAGVFLEHLVFLLGRVGLTNLARSQAATEGDCSDCECNTGDLSVWVPYDGDAGIIDMGSLTVTNLVVDAQIRGDGKYYIILLAPSSGYSADVNFALTDGGLGDCRLGWSLTGETPSDVVLGAHNSGVGSSLGASGKAGINALLFRSDSPFQMTLSTAC